MIELKNNYPRFDILARDSESEEDILERIRTKGKRLESIFEEEFETNSDKMLISLLEGEENCIRAKVNLPANLLSRNESKSTTNYEAGNKLSEENSQPALEAAETRSKEPDQEKEEECTECIITEQNSFPSQSIQVQCSTDKILVLPT